MIFALFTQNTRYGWLFLCKVVMAPLKKGTVKKNKRASRKNESNGGSGWAAGCVRVLYIPVVRLVAGALDGAQGGRACIRINLIIRVT